MSLPPFPRDPIVDKQGFASQEFLEYQELQVVPTIEAAPSLVKSVDDESLNDAVALAVLIPSAAQALYRFSWAVQILTPDPVANSVQVVLTYTRNGVVQTETFTAVTGILTTTHGGSVFPFRVDGGTPISYQVNYASNTPNACVYALTVTVEVVQVVG